MGCWRLFGLMFMVAFLAVSTSFKSANSDPQITLVNEGCNLYPPGNSTEFYSNFNDTFADLRNQLFEDSKSVATAQINIPPNPVFVLFHCRDYLSTADCISCFNTAVSRMQKCSPGAGGRVIYDGCFLRLEGQIFYDQAVVPGNGQVCGNQTASQLYQNQADALLQDLRLATPRINGYFAATKRQLSNGSDALYAVAQCAKTVNQSGCQDCMRVAYGNIQVCLPNTDGRAYDTGCFMRYSATPFFSDNQTTDINPYLGAAGGRANKRKAIIFGAVFGVFLLLVMLALLLWYQLFTKSTKVEKGDIFGTTELHGPLTYDYKVLKSATKDFSEENKLGEGGFSEVYKGTMKDGKVVAVKKLNITSGRAKAEFVSEVRLISTVHHKNLVRLLGYANRGAALLLVYEYMANGSLGSFLYGDKKGYLDWKKRFNIISGVAKGLAYLHEQSHACIIHRDIKSSNILLDGNFLPKIADFGLAKLLPGDRSHLSTGFAGTLGYTAPEYAVHGHLSEKVDTYGFGIVILEIISGTRSNNMPVGAVGEFLLEKACKLHETNAHLQLVDETLDPKDYDAAQVKKAIELALICTRSQPSERPAMSEVVTMLSNDQPIKDCYRSNSNISSDTRLSGEETMTSNEDSPSNSTTTPHFIDYTGR